MTGLQEKLRKEASAKSARVLLVGDDDRTLEAGEYLNSEGIAEVRVVKGVEDVGDVSQLTDEYVLRRTKRGDAKEAIEEALCDPLFIGELGGAGWRG